MFLRRLFFRWQFLAVVLLPLWLLVGWPLFGAGGWEVLGIFFGAVTLGICLLVVSLLIYARKDVREARAVSWPDVGVLALWHALVIGLGFYAAASPWLSALVILVGIGAFWFAVWELYDAARRRVRVVIDLIDETARLGPVSGGAGQGGARPGTGQRAGSDPTVIVIQEKPTHS